MSSSNRGPLRSSGDTPGKKPAKVRRDRDGDSSSKKALFGAGVHTVKVEAKSSSPGEWTESELSALIQYIALYHNDAESYYCISIIHPPLRTTSEHSN